MTQQINFLGPNTEDLQINLLWNDANGIQHGCIATFATEGERNLNIYISGKAVLTIQPSQLTKEQAAYIRELI